MAQQLYPPSVIVDVLINHFFKHRGLVLAPRGLAPGAAAPRFDSDRIIADMDRFGYVRLDALRAAPRGRRDWAVFLVLGEGSKYAHHSPDLRPLLEGVSAEAPAKEGRLDELTVVADERFFTRKNMVDVIRDAGRGQVAGPDPDGTAPFFSAHPYHMFALVVPDHVSVPAHQLMTPAETEALLAREKLARADLPVIFATDPPIVWIGGRPGQVVRIVRDSQTAGTAHYYRRIERGEI